MNLMTLPPVEQLERLSRDELLALVKSLISIIERQQRQIAELEAEIAKLRQSPANSATLRNRRRGIRKPIHLRTRSVENRVCPTRSTWDLR
jgi:hypothetical protein